MAKNINRRFITAIAAVFFLIAGMVGAGTSVAASDVPYVQFDVQTNCKVGIVVSVSVHGNPTVSELGARWHNLSQSLNGYSGLEVGHTPISVDVRVDKVTLYATINGVSKSAEVDLFGPCGEASASVVIYGDMASQPWMVTSVSFACSGVVNATLSSGSSTGGIIFFVYQNGEEIDAIGQSGVIGETEYSQSFDTSSWVSGAEMQAAVLLPGTTQPRVYSNSEICDGDTDPGNGEGEDGNGDTDPGNGNGEDGNDDTDPGNGNGEDGNDDTDPGNGNGEDGNDDTGTDNGNGDGTTDPGNGDDGNGDTGANNGNVDNGEGEDGNDDTDGEGAETINPGNGGDSNGDTAVTTTTNLPSTGSGTATVAAGIGSFMLLIFASYATGVRSYLEMRYR